MAYKPEEVSTYVTGYDRAKGFPVLTTTYFPFDYSDYTSRLNLEECLTWSSYWPNWPFIEPERPSGPKWGWLYQTRTIISNNLTWYDNLCRPHFAPPTSTITDLPLLSGCIPEPSPILDPPFVFSTRSMLIPTSTPAQPQETPDPGPSSTRASHVVLVPATTPLNVPISSIATSPPTPLPQIDPQAPPAENPQTPPAEDPQAPPAEDPQAPPTEGPQAPPTEGPSLPNAPIPVVVTIDHTSVPISIRPASPSEAPVVIIGSHTISAGSPAVTIGNTAVSLGNSGHLVVGSHTMAIPSAVFPAQDPI